MSTERDGVGRGLAPDEMPLPRWGHRYHLGHGRDGRRGSGTQHSTRARRTGSVSGVAKASPGPPFSHTALLYADDDEFLAGTIPFVTHGLERGEAVLVVVPKVRIDQLRSHFDRANAGLLSFAPMEDVGRNPAWIIPAWADFLNTQTQAGRSARGIGEPIWPGRSDDELVECQRHEALLNLAFADTAGFKLLCPYQTTMLDPSVVEDAQHHHPDITHQGCRAASDRFQREVPSYMDDAGSPLSRLPPTARLLAFDADSLPTVRHLTAATAATAGVTPLEIEDLLVAVGEAASNSIEHGGGSGRMALWDDGTTFLCEIRDQGRITDPLAGRVRPNLDQSGGRGLWLMNQLCDLVQVRAVDGGQVVRLHLRI
jgi:anti-sigma regulatory factor (Ser/Thr protein kinase)